MNRTRTSHIFGDSDVSDDEIILIEERRKEIVENIAPNMEDLRYAPMISETRGSKGSMLHLRQMSFLKIGLINNGRPLIDHWDAIKRELGIPWHLHFWEVNPASAYRSDLANYFHITDYEPTKTEVTLDGEGWQLRKDSTIPGYSVIPDDEAFHLLNFCGGIHPDEEHTV